MRQARDIETKRRRDEVRRHHCVSASLRLYVSVPSAFTLVELMISVALMLLLMLGVNLIFRMSGQAIGAGQAISEAMRNGQSAQSVMSRDFAAMAVKDSPFIILFSHTQPAFRNRTDQLSDRDYDPSVASQTTRNTRVLTTDLDGDNIEGEVAVPGEITSAATYNSRNHRTDTFSFFARDSFRRQTGGEVGSNGVSPLIADMGSNECWIWYGHLRVYNGTGPLNLAGSFPTPGDGSFSGNSNPTNFYANQWTLGRQATLLVEPTGVTGSSSGTITDSSGAAQIFVHIPPPGVVSRSPLSYAAHSNASDANGGADLPSSRFDLAGTSITGYRQRLRDYIVANPTNDWWLGLGGAGLFCSDDERFRCSPIVAKPITPAGIALQAPIFLPSCSQLIVEFAGDFVSQNASTGVVEETCFDTSVNPDTRQDTDGMIDYVQTGAAPNITRTIRWYGMPRDTNGNSRIRWDDGDVVPLRDFWQQHEPGSNAPFERDIPPGPPTNPEGYYTTLAASETYLCAWGPDDPVRPSMYRITIVLDDPAGRLPEGQTFEFVFKVQ